MAEWPAGLAILDDIQQCREEMRQIEAGIDRTVRLTRSVIDASRRAMAEADRLLNLQGGSPEVRRPKL
jgi:hypothetical protein